MKIFIANYISSRITIFRVHGVKRKYISTLTIKTIMCILNAFYNFKCFQFPVSKVSAFAMFNIHLLVCDLIVTYTSCLFTSKGGFNYVQYLFTWYIRCVNLCIYSPISFTFEVPCTVCIYYFMYFLSSRLSIM